MWDPPDNVSESLDPSPPANRLTVGTEYTCILACPQQYQHREYQLRVMDQQDFESDPDEQRKKNLSMLPAQMDGNGILTGQFTPQADWPQQVRIGFADPRDKLYPFGLGGTEVYEVG